MSSSLLSVDQDSVEDETIAVISQMTERMFGAEPVVEEECDPDAPENHWIVFSVPIDGDPKHIVDSQLSWYAELRRMVPDVVDEYRLSAYVSE